MRLDKNRFDYAAPKDLSSPTQRDITLGWVDKYHITEKKLYNTDDYQSFGHFIHVTLCGIEQKKLLEILKIYCKSNLQWKEEQRNNQSFLRGCDQAAGGLLLILGINNHN